MVVQVITANTKKINLYSDFRKDLALSPISNDLARINDEEAVKESLRNLLMTEPGERLMQPYIGAGLRGLLFENMTPATMHVIRERVVDTIETYEPRAELIDVNVTSEIDDYTVRISVQFYIQNRLQPISLDVILERTR